MDDKYYKLQDIVIDTFDLDAPIEIEEGVLLLDKTSKNVFLKLKLNVLDVDISRVSSVSLRIDCLDDAMEIITEISPYIFTYRDIFLIDSKTFGEDNPILLDDRVRRINVGISKVVFTDTSTWQPTAHVLIPPNQVLINSLKPELVDQFQRDIRFLSPAEKERYIYIPEQLDDYWLCTCGRPNKNDAIACSRCMLSKTEAFTSSEETLQKNLVEHKENVRLEAEKFRIASDKAKLLAIEKARIEEENNARLLAEEKVRSKRLKTGFFITGIIGLLIVLFFNVILPALKYSQASDYLANKEYNYAIYVFDSLGNYKNSEGMVYEANYQKATDFLTDKKLDDAIKTFSYIMTYRDSDTMIMEANYQKAKAFFQEGNYPEAILIFSRLENFGDSTSYLRDSRGLLAEEYLADKDYPKAIEILETLANYENAVEVLIDTKYLLALEYYELGEFASAKSIFQGISNYKDSNSYLQNLDILNGIQGNWVQDELGNTISGWKTVRFEGWKFLASKANDIDDWFEKEFSESSLTDYGLSISVGMGDFTFEFDYTNQTLVLNLAVPIDYLRQQ